MTRPNKRRNEISPLVVRMSPSERAELAKKAERAGIRPSDFARAAIAAYNPKPKERT